LLLSVGLLPENELAKQAGVQLSPVTGGASVNESMMTSIDGVFECGNVLHVHDLVDFVSEESIHAGECAAAYLEGKTASGESTQIEVFGGVRYCVPQHIVKSTDGEEMSLKMRVSNVFRKVRIRLLADGEEIVGKNKQIVTPGEMETLSITAEQAKKLKSAQKISVGLEVR
jgi:pyruvate/2-oxoglutarate dehydrogenase complex dihydrolipoamide dehydrogenase (E3) component